MRVLVICQYYYPEPFRINDICEELVKRGHEVSVITGKPNYPEGEIYIGYDNHSHTDEVINGVNVHRCPIIPRKTGSFYRMLNYFSYPYLAGKYIKKTIQKKFDVIFVNQLSPVMMAKPAIVFKKKFDVPVLMYCLDLWPESLVAGGIKRGSLIYKLFHKISEMMYKNMDYILVTSEMFQRYLKDEFGVKDKNTAYLPQYAEGLFKKLPYKEPSGIVNLVFAGNIGAVQSVETIIDAARLTVTKPVHFHIVGNGSNLEKIKKISSDLENVTIYGRRPIEEMMNFYSMADAMLVTLRADSVLSLTLPGKVQSYMAVGKPIIGAVDGETAEIIKKAECGFCGPADDATELAKNICLFIDEKRKKELGLNARAFYEKHFERQKFMDKLEDYLYFICRRNDEKNV